MILVTGGAGFIGSHLVRQLVEAGEQVRVLEERRAEASHLPLDSIELRRGDIRCVEEVREAVRGCRQVYHLAANPHLWTRHPADFEAVNHQGTCHVLHEALRAGAERVLYTSTESIPRRHADEGQNRGTVAAQRREDDRPVLPQQAQGRAGSLPAGGRGRSRHRGLPDAAGRTGRPSSDAALAHDAGLLPGEAARLPGLRVQHGRRARRGDGHARGDEGRTPRRALSAGRGQPAADRMADDRGAADGPESAAVAGALRSGAAGGVRQRVGG